MGWLCANCKTALERVILILIPGFPGGWLRSEASASSAADAGSTPGSGRSPGGGHGNPLQYPCLESPMDRGAWRATVHRVSESDRTK